MVKRVEDLVGKWFSNVGGIPDEYFYVLSAEKKTDRPFEPIEAEYVLVRRNYVRVTTNDFRTLGVFGTPLTKQKHPELNYQIHKCIKYLFEKRK